MLQVGQIGLISSYSNMNYSILCIKNEVPNLI